MNEINWKQELLDSEKFNQKEDIIQIMIFYE